MDLLLDSLGDFDEFHDDSVIYNPDLDSPNGDCTDQCDAFTNDKDLNDVGF